MYRKIIQSTKFVYILYTKIVQIKILYDNECTKKLHYISTQLQLYKKCTKCRYTKLYKVQTKKDLKLEMYVFCTYKHCTNYTKCIQNINRIIYAAADVCFLYTKPHSLPFKYYRTNTALFTFQILQNQYCHIPLYFAFL